MSAPEPPEPFAPREGRARRAWGPVLREGGATLAGAAPEMVRREQATRPAERPAERPPERPPERSSLPVPIPASTVPIPASTVLAPSPTILAPAPSVPISAPARRAAPPWLVAVRLEGLDRSQRRAVARQSGIRPEDLEDRGLPEWWAAEVAADGAMAEVEAARLRAMGIEAVAVSTAAGSSWPALLAALVIGGLAILSAPFTAAMSILAMMGGSGSLFGGLPFLLTLAASAGAVLLGQRGSRGWGRGAIQAQAIRSREQRGRLMNRNPDGASVRARELLDALVEASARAELPAAVLLDARRFLRSGPGEARIEALEQALAARDMAALARIVEQEDPEGGA